MQIMAKASTSNMNTGEIVLSAIKKLMTNTAWTTRTITKFIRTEYEVNDPKIGRKVSRALKRGVKLGVLQMNSGRYRLNNMSRLTRRMNAREIRKRVKRQRQRPLRLCKCTPHGSTRDIFNRKTMARTSTTNSNTGEIVLSAIKKLMTNTGWTTRTIVKFIKMEYQITDSKIGPRISRALKRGVRLGLLQYERGRYRLNNMSSLARHVSTHEIRRRQRARQRERPLQIRSHSPSA